MRGDGGVPGQEWARFFFERDVGVPGQPGGASFHSSVLLKGV
jgi:hypothetical protein